MQHCQRACTYLLHYQPVRVASESHAIGWAQGGEGQLCRVLLRVKEKPRVKLHGGVYAQGNEGANRSDTCIHVIAYYRMHCCRIHPAWRLCEKTSLKLHGGVHAQNNEGACDMCMDMPSQQLGQKLGRLWSETHLQC